MRGSGKIGFRAQPGFRFGGFMCDRGSLNPKGGPTVALALGRIAKLCAYLGR